MTRTLNQKAVDRMRQRNEARRPWQLLMVGTGEHNRASVSAETTYALTRLLEYLPGISGVTLQTEHGDLDVTRDFPSGEMQIIDGLIASIFKNDPHITGIKFPATDGKAAHIATAEEPHFLVDKGKQVATPRKT